MQELNDLLGISMEDLVVARVLELVDDDPDILACRVREPRPSGRYCFPCQPNPIRILERSLR